MNVTVDQLYNDLWAEARPGFEERLGTSLQPRGPLRKRVVAMITPRVSSRDR